MLRPLALLFLIGISACADNPTRETWNGIHFELFVAKPASIELHWLGADGNPILRFAEVRKQVEGRGDRPLMLTNGGIFEPGRIPTGLHVQNGQVLRPLNRKNGKGNFYLLPNGVFGIDRSNRAFVKSTTDYATANLRPRHAIQSGPLLLTDGNIHPSFNPESKHRRHRNGVGILPNGNVLFAITAKNQRKYVTLYEFAQLFQRHQCRDALFLDGDLSAMITDFTQPTKVLNEYAAIIAVSGKGEAKDTASEPNRRSK